MNRYKFSKENIQKAIKFLAGKIKKGPSFATKYKDDLKVKNKKLFFQDKEIIPADKVDDVLRKKIYKFDDTPTGRDSCFHLIKQAYVGISRRNIMEFLRKQSPLDSRPSVPQAKQKSGKKFQTYCFETDLIFLKKDDLVRVNPRFERKELPELSYFVSSCEKITGLYRCDYVTTKDSEIVTPIVIKHFESMAADLKVDPKTCIAQMDSGGEFTMKDIREILKSAKNIPMGPSIENKNRNFQKNFFNVLKSRKALTIKTAMKKASLMMNNTLNRIHNKTPLELVKRNSKSEDIKEYNRKRPKYVASRKRELKVGDYCKILIKKFKEKLDYKTYKEKTWGKKVYIVKKKTKKQPTKYYVNKKWRLVDDLLKSSLPDKETEKMLQELDDSVAVEDREERKEDFDDSMKEAKEKIGKKREHHVLGRMNKLKKQRKQDLILDEEEDEEVGRERKPKPKPKKKVEKVEVYDEEAEKKKYLINFLKQRGKPYFGTFQVLKARVRVVRKQEREEKRKKK